MIKSVKQAMKNLVKNIKESIKNLLLMIQFLTRIPINMNLPCEKENFKKASIFFPVIGLIIGVVQWGIYKLLIKVLPLNLTVVFVLLIGVLITGGLHVDGLGDTCDGFFSFKGNKDKIIEIMKDSRVGTYACIAIIFDFLFRYSALEFVVSKFSIVIIAAPIISRVCTMFISLIGKQAKVNGSGNLFIGNVGKKQFFISLFIGVGILSLIMNPRYVIILIATTLIFTSIFNLFCNMKIGGLTGDSLGASNELNEMLVLILISIILK